MKYAILLKLALACALFHTVLCIPKGLATNVSSICSKTAPCLWTDTRIWSDGVVPNEVDTVDFQVAGTYTIQVTSDVKVSDFHFGIDELKDNGKQVFQVLNGVTFTSTSSFRAFIGTTVQVDQGARFLVTNAGFTQGYFILNGYASFGGSNPSLEIDTRNLQNPADIDYGRLTMAQGSALLVSNGLQVSATSRIEGSGIVNGTIFLNGNLRPGTNGAIGRLDIVGDLVMASTTDIYIDVASVNSFDQVVITGAIAQDGDLFINTINYTPLSHSEFIVFNHTRQRGGFDKTSEDCTITCINNKWQAVVDQDYTAILYDSASTTLISLFLIASCIFFTLF